MVNNPKNKVVAKLTIDPESLQRVNITIKTPRENVTMRYVPVPLRLAPLNTHRSIVSTYLNDLTNDKFERKRIMKSYERQYSSNTVSTLFQPSAKSTTSESEPSMESDTKFPSPPATQFWPRTAALKTTSPSS